MNAVLVFGSILTDHDPIQHIESAYSLVLPSTTLLTMMIN